MVLCAARFEYHCQDCDSAGLLWDFRDCVEVFQVILNIMERFLDISGYSLGTRSSTVSETCINFSYDGSVPCVQLNGPVANT